MRPILRAVCVLVAGALAQPIVAQGQTTLFMDDFSGAGGPLNGTTPDVTTAGEVWEAGPTFLDNGQADTPIAAGADGQAAHLDYIPQAGFIYTAEATILNTNPNWVAFGFLPDNPPAGVTDWTVQNFAVRHSNAPGYAWALTRNHATANDQEGFLGGGTATPQTTWNGNVVDPTQPVKFKIVLNTSGANWTAEWFINDVSRSMATYAAAGNPGIGGIGFSHERNATANSGAMLDSFSLIQSSPPTTLRIVVNTTTGVTRLQNGSAAPITFDYYVIESAGGALNPTSWTSLDDQNIDSGLPADFDNSGAVNGADLTLWKGDFGLNADSDADGDGDSDCNDFLAWQRQVGQSPGPVDGWGEAGGSSTALLAELFVNGATTLAAGAELNLGTAFNPATFGAGNNGDLTFQFSSPGGGLQLGTVSYVTAATPAAAAVPEPSALAVAGALGAVGLAARRRR
jgi:hypothetical protein